MPEDNTIRPLIIFRIPSDADRYAREKMVEDIEKLKGNDVLLLEERISIVAIDNQGRITTAPPILES